MISKKLLTIMARDIIKSKCKKESFKSECYWNEFLEFTVSTIMDYWSVWKVLDHLERHLHIPFKVLRLTLEKYNELQYKDYCYSLKD